MGSFVCNFSKLELCAHYKAKNYNTVKTNYNTVKTNFLEYAHTHIQTQSIG